MHAKKDCGIKGYELLSENGIVCQVGFGSCGVVQLAKCLKSQNLVAIKKIPQKLAQN